MDVTIVAASYRWWELMPVLCENISREEVHQCYHFRSTEMNEEMSSPDLSIYLISNSCVQFWATTYMAVIGKRQSDILSFYNFLIF